MTSSKCVCNGFKESNLSMEQLWYKTTALREIVLALVQMKNGPLAQKTKVGNAIYCDISFLTCPFLSLSSCLDMG